MKPRSVGVRLTGLFIAFLPASALLSRRLTFDQKNKTQEVIESVALCPDLIERGAL